MNDPQDIENAVENEIFSCMNIVISSKDEKRYGDRDWIIDEIKGYIMRKALQFGKKFGYWRKKLISYSKSGRSDIDQVPRNRWTWSDYYHYKAYSAIIHADYFHAEHVEKRSFKPGYN